VVPINRHRELPAPPMAGGAWRSDSSNLTAEIATGGMLLAFLPRNDSFWAEREGAQPLPYDSCRDCEKNHNPSTVSG